MASISGFRLSELKASSPHSNSSPKHHVLTGKLTRVVRGAHALSTLKVYKPATVGIRLDGLLILYQQQMNGFAMICIT